MDRRHFLRQTTFVGCGAMLGAAYSSMAAAAEQSKLHVACNEWNWSTFYRRDGRNFTASLDAGLAEVAQSGMNGFEASAVETPEQVDYMAALLKKHGLQMRSLYVGSVLHEANAVDKSIAHILAIAERAKLAGTQIIVTNPSPLPRIKSVPQDKTDAQLTIQGAALEQLGKSLADGGLILAYHNHDVELRNAAREFHHMMTGTDPRYVRLCLDTHWIYRGSGNSSVALFDVMKLYGQRICELHLRQSTNNVWSEAFGDGDIDYRAVAKYLKRMGVRPHLVLEQGPEKGTPKTMDAVESHRRGGQYVREVFAELAS